jgi:hypothetical protein
MAVCLLMLFSFGQVCDPVSRFVKIFGTPLRQCSSHFDFGDDTPPAGAMQLMDMQRQPEDHFYNVEQTKMNTVKSAPARDHAAAEAKPKTKAKPKTAREGKRETAKQ